MFPAPHAFSPSEQHRATDHNAGDGLIFTPESSKMAKTQNLVFPGEDTVDDQKIFLVTNAPDLLKPCLCLRLDDWAICPKKPTPLLFKIEKTWRSVPLSLV